jgi:hypothetical protein
LARGSVSDVLAEVEDLQLEVEKEVKVLDKSEQVVEGKNPAEIDRKDGKLIVTEEIQEGHVSWSACKLVVYARSRSMLTVATDNLLFASLGGSHPVLFYISFLGSLLLAKILSAGQVVFACVVALSRVPDTFLDLVDGMVGRTVRPFRPCGCQCCLVSSLCPENGFNCSPETVISGSSCA